MSCALLSLKSKIKTLQSADVKTKTKSKALNPKTDAETSKIVSRDHNTARNHIDECMIAPCFAMQVHEDIQCMTCVPLRQPESHIDTGLVCTG